MIYNYVWFNKYFQPKMKQQKRFEWKVIAHAVSRTIISPWETRYVQLKEVYFFLYAALCGKLLSFFMLLIKSDAVTSILWWFRCSCAFALSFMLYVHCRDAISIFKFLEFVNTLLDILEKKQIHSCSQSEILTKINNYPIQFLNSVVSG